MGETVNVTDIQTNYSTSVPEVFSRPTGNITVSPLFSSSTTPLLNSTYGNVTQGHGSSTPTSFSFAFIPLFAVFIFLVVLWIQCCKWFRRYSSGDKSDKAFYEIVDPDDDPLSGVEMSPDSAYASYCSTSRRRHSDENDSINIHSTAGNTDCVINRELSHRKGEPIDETITTLIQNDAKENNNRKSSSSSSSQTTMTSCSESEPGNSSENSRKLNKFKVSFVKENARESEAHFIKLNKYCTDTGRTLNHSSRNRSNDVQRACAECVFCAERQTSILLKDIATQTNKSFIYSLKFPKRNRSANKHRVEPNGIDNSRIHKGKRSLSKNGLSDRDTQTNSNNNNNKEVKICNGGVCDVIDKDLTVINVTCSKSPTKTEQQNGQIDSELTTNC